MSLVVAKVPIWNRLADFVWKELLCSIFPIGIFGVLALSKLVHIPGLPRYDMVLLLCIGLQAGMIWLKLETLDELKVILVFHVLGLAMEIHKTSIGSWAYPEPSLLRIGNVPVYSGFMYASVASYICQAWRRFDLGIVRLPRMWVTFGLATAIYLNFFTCAIWPDMRWPLSALTFLAFWGTWAEFTVSGVRQRMPLTLSFVLIGASLWFAENIGTFLGGWRYPHQEHGWQMVEPLKANSWFLLVIVSFVLVAQLKRIKSDLAHP